MRKLQDILTDPVLQDLSVVELGDVLFDVYQPYYEEKPVDIETFITSPHFLGDIFEDEIDEDGNVAHGFYPFWLDFLKKIHPSPFWNPFFEVILHLPIGSGKSVSSLTSILYECYKLVCLKDPAGFYGIKPAGTNIVFTLFSASKTLAQDDNWGRLAGMIDKCPWFRDRGIIAEGKSLKSDPTIVLSKGVSITVGSSEIHALGKAVFGGALDEANFQRVKSQQAQSSYSSMIRRMESRFLDIGGTLPGILWLLSSPKFSSDFLNKRIEAADGSERTTVLHSTPIWDIKEHLGIYNGKTFPVFVGDETTDPKILDDSQKGFEEARIYQVPIEYKEAFNKDLLSAIRDIIGLPIQGVTSLFKSREAIVQVMTAPHHFSKEVLSLPFEGGVSIIDHADLTHFNNPPHPECWRFIHIDNGLVNDRLGMAAVYVLPSRDYYFRTNEEALTRNDRFYFTDFVLSIKARPNEEVPLHKVEDFFSYLREKNYPIKLITTDSFQSRHLMQDLRRMGYVIKLASVDRTRDPYISLRNIIHQRKLILPRHQLLLDELKYLQDDGKKIDHTEYSSKDLTDGLAGAVYNALKADEIIKHHLIKPDQMSALANIIRKGGKEQKLREMAQDLFPEMTEVML